MKHCLKILLLTLVLTCSMPHILPAQSARLTIMVDGFENDSGSLQLAIIDRAEEFKEGGHSFLEKKVQIINKTVTVTVEDLPYGEYAIQLYHDENDNGQLDRFPLLGWPTERYGFSNNSRNSSGRASFEQAKFILKAEHRTLSISVMPYF